MPVLSGLFQDGDSSSDCRSDDSPGSRLPSFVLQGKTPFPEMFQTSHLLFYERFRAYQDYILGEQALLHAFRLPVHREAVSGPQTAAVGSEHADVNGPADFPLLAQPQRSLCLICSQLTARPPR